MKQTMYTESKKSRDQNGRKKRKLNRRELPPIPLAPRTARTKEERKKLKHPHFQQVTFFLPPPQTGTDIIVVVRYILYPHDTILWRGSVEQSGLVSPVSI